MTFGIALAILLVSFIFPVVAYVGVLWLAKMILIFPLMASLRIVFFVTIVMTVVLVDVTAQRYSFANLAKHYFLG
jgi:hypothetical protein